VHRGRQTKGSQVRPVEEAEKVRKTLAGAWAEDRDETFGESQLADRESVAGLFQRAKWFNARCWSATFPSTA
jgi:hypothetical protein